MNAMQSSDARKRSTKAARVTPLVAGGAAVSAAVSSIVSGAVSRITRHAAQPANEPPAPGHDPQPITLRISQTPVRLGAHLDSASGAGRIRDNFRQTLPCSGAMASPCGRSIPIRVSP
ncbi:hypothetical protein P0D87_07830 [Paraburkholderia sp. RL17-368-BIF-A]|uniref:hypothetical protein n=1 Tax=Paraburkholderia sp. RL17-368-BIF-A TaxID=3031628 RepID=UPI000A80B305